MLEIVTDRRTLFRGVIGMALGYSAANLDSGLKGWFVTDIPPTAMRIDLGVLSRLDLLSAEMASRIRLVGFDESLKPRVIPSSVMFAKALVRMAYLDGGQDEVANVNDTIKDIGISVIAEDLPQDIRGVTRIDFKDPQDFYRITKIEIGIDLDYVTAENTYWHELYHVIQVAKNPKIARTPDLSRSIISSPILPLGIAALSGFRDLFGIRQVGITRRLLWKRLGLGAVAMGVGSWLGVRVGYSLQTEDPVHQQLDQRLALFSVHPFIKELQGNLFMYEQSDNYSFSTTL